MINVAKICVAGLVEVSKFYYMCADSQDGVANLVAAILKPILIISLAAVSVFAAIDTWYDFKTSSLE